MTSIADGEVKDLSREKHRRNCQIIKNMYTKYIDN